MLQVRGQHPRRPQPATYKRRTCEGLLASHSPGQAGECKKRPSYVHGPSEDGSLRYLDSTHTRVMAGDGPSMDTRRLLTACSLGFPPCHHHSQANRKATFLLRPASAWRIRGQLRDQ